MEAKPTITNILAQANGGLMINATSDIPNMEEVSAFILYPSVPILILYCHWSFQKVNLTCPCRIPFLQQLMVSVTSPPLLILPFLCLSDLSYSQPFSTGHQFRHQFCHQCSQQCRISKKHPWGD